jgi:hypothetical protein
VGNCKNFKNKMYLKLGKLTIVREVQQENKKRSGHLHRRKKTPKSTRKV